MGQKKLVQAVKERRSLSVAIAREDNASVTHVTERERKGILDNKNAFLGGVHYDTS